MPDVRRPGNGGQWRAPPPARQRPRACSSSPRGHRADVAKMEAERGLDRQDLSSQCLKLGEEVGELYRAIRKLQGHPQDPAGRIADIGDEAVDTLILLMSIVNR